MPFSKKIRQLDRIRHSVQLMFLVLWLWPSAFLQRLPSCVFHCYACPLASFACPIGLIATYSSLHVIPWLVIGVLVMVGALVGSLVCGWACPFGFVQDLLMKIPVRKFQLPQWTRFVRLGVLLAFVIAIPWFLGKDHPLAICNICPVGALEAGLPYSIKQAFATGGEVWWTPSWYKTVILIVTITAAVFIYRPWCRLLCPLGALLGIFNRLSVFHLRFMPSSCTECNLCRTNCPVGVEVDNRANTSACIRCLKCTTCGGLKTVILPTPGKTTVDTFETSQIDDI